MTADTEADRTTPPSWRRSPWLPLGAVWAGLLLLVAGTGITLQLLGPPAPRPSTPHPAETPATKTPATEAPATETHTPKTQTPAAHAAETHASETHTAEAHAQPPAPAPTNAQPPSQTAANAHPAPPKPRGPPGPGAPIAAADDALSAPDAEAPDLILPRIAPDGRKPWQVYAAGFDRADKSPRVAILLAGIGMAADNDAAAARLPGMISFAISPYAPHPDDTAATARAGGHELLLGLPLEPQGYPLNDPGPLALLTGATTAVNTDRYRHVLALFQGYAGITNAIGAMRGERFSGSEAMNDLLRDAASRGLMYVDARPGAAAPEIPGLPARAADLVIDQPPTSSEIDLALARLIETARQRGSALGIASAPTPVTVLRLAEWANALAKQGILLVPASALMRQTEAKAP